MSKQHSTGRNPSPGKRKRKPDELEMINQLRQENRELKAQLDNCIARSNAQAEMLLGLELAGKITVTLTDQAPENEVMVNQAAVQERERLASAATANEIRRNWETKGVPAMEAMTNFAHNINWLNGFVEGAMTKGRIEMMQAALDSWVGRIGYYRDEVLQKSLALGEDVTRQAFQEIDSISRDYQMALTALLNDKDITPLNSVTTHYVVSEVRDRLIEKWREMAAGGELGGRNASDPVLNAIRRQAAPLFQEHGNEWAKIRDILWKNIEYRTAKNPRNDDEMTIYKAWKIMTHKDRREQVRTAFRG